MKSDLLFAFAGLPYTPNMVLLHGRNQAVQMHSPTRAVSRRSALELMVGMTAVVVCVDVSRLAPGARSLRASLRYGDIAPQPAERCGVCVFFKVAADAPGCGTCQILSGPVAQTGHCDSWAKKG